MEKKFKGISASPGIAICQAFYYIDEAITVPEYDIAPEDVGGEVERLEVACREAEKDIQKLKERSQGDLPDQALFLDAHLLMLVDDEFQGRIKRNIGQWLKNTEFCLLETVKTLTAKLKKLRDPYIKERAVDIEDVARRVLSHLINREQVALNNLKHEVILVAHNLMPSEAMALHQGKIIGLATDVGGKTSHTAILARSCEIPAVLGLSDITSHIKNNDLIVVDGDKGLVIVDPDEETLLYYRQSVSRHKQEESALSAFRNLEAVTRDQKRLLLKANIELPEEIAGVKTHGADGIGLFRSEFVFLSPEGIADEERQRQMYVKVLQDMGGKPVTIRTLDVGGDKFIPDLQEQDEKNPLLGWRAIRFCLSRKDIFRTQIRALLRASTKGNLRIMFPLVSGPEELDELLAFVDEIKGELKKEGRPFDENIPLGIMIEVPSAAIIIDILAKKVDFVSIGTNDLVQYTMAVDRGNEKVAYLYDYFHPAILRTLDTIITKSHQADLKVAMCGEMAGQTLCSVLLLGLGLDEFSMNAFAIPPIKKILREVSFVEAADLVDVVMEKESASEITAYMEKWMRERFPDLNI